MPDIVANPVPIACGFFQGGSIAGALLVNCSAEFDGDNQRWEVTCNEDIGTPLTHVSWCLYGPAAIVQVSYATTRTFNLSQIELDETPTAGIPMSFIIWKLAPSL